MATETHSKFTFTPEKMVVGKRSFPIVCLVTFSGALAVKTSGGIVLL